MARATAQERQTAKYVLGGMAVLTAIGIALGAEIALNGTAFGFEFPDTTNGGFRALALLAIGVTTLASAYSAHNNAYFLDKYKVIGS